MNNLLEYTYDQNFVINNDPTSDDQLKVTNPIQDGNGDITFNAINSLNVTLATFILPLYPPKAEGIKKVTIKNINASLTTTNGYLFELRCPSLFRYPIQFLDSLSTFTQSIEHKDFFPLQIPFELRRISGPKNLTTNGTAGALSQWLANPALSLTLTYHYY